MFEAKISKFSVNQVVQAALPSSWPPERVDVSGGGGTSPTLDLLENRDCPGSAGAQSSPVAGFKDLTQDQISLVLGAAAFTPETT